MKKVYIQDFCSEIMKSCDGVEPSLTGEIGEKPKVENQNAHRVEKKPLDLLINIVPNGPTASIIWYAITETIA